MTKNNLYLIGFPQSIMVREIANSLDHGAYEIKMIEPGRFLAGETKTTDLHLVCVTRDMHLRKTIVDKLNHGPYSRYTYIHPSSVISPDAVIGAGSFIAAFALVGAKCRVGDHCIVNPYCLVGHLSDLGEGSIMNPFSAISGSTNVGKFCKLGIRSTAIDKISMTDFVELAAASTLTKSVEQSGFYVGSPARRRIQDAQPDFV